MDRELEIRAAEERLLVNDAPKTPDEFERLVRSSPNSSFVWLKYMAFMLSLADVEKARSIAERYSLLLMFGQYMLTCSGMTNISF